MKAKHLIVAIVSVAGFAIGRAELRPSCLSMKEVYLGLMEKAVSAYTPDHVRTYLESVEKDGLKEHGFPRLTSNIGVLVATGRHPVGAEFLPRMMDACCSQIPVAKARAGNRVGNDFSVKEIVMCLEELEKAKSFPKERLVAWRRGLASIVPETTYSVISVPEAKKAQNWAVFTAASEQTRISAGIGGDPAFVEGQIANQIRFFDENGMYKDPNQPMVYDGVTRLQFALALYRGYDGPSRPALEAMMLKAAEPTLKMQSVTGEIPFGGRSNQFLHNEGFLCALSEWYAAWFAKRGDREMARRFRVAARRAVDSLGCWLAANPVRHVKNMFPRDSKYGCESYGYFDKYMVTLGSWAYLAYRFCDETVPNDERAEDSAPRAFATGPEFHRVMLNAGGYTAQFDLAADGGYDASGLGRVHRKGAPSATCLSVPAARKPHYGLDLENPSPFAILPGVRTEKGAKWLYDAEYVCRKAEETGSAARAELSVKGKGGETLEWRAEVGEDGVSMRLSGDGEIGLVLPALIFDGERRAEVRIDGSALEVRYRGWLCRYETDGKLADAGLIYGNRNGHYRRYEVFGRNVLNVRITITKCDAAVTFSAGNAEVVVAPGTKATSVVGFAAEEATNFLSRVLGAPVPIVNAPTPGKASLVLGENTWSKEAGIDPSKHPRDTFIIRTAGGKVFVAGVDGKANPRRASVMSYERGTLLGTYAFLEDYAGCRFYFPGELGEVTPRRDSFEVPVTDRTVTPNCLIRKYYNGDGEWFGGEKAKEAGKHLNWLRVRASTTSIPCCHGTAYMKLVEKYSKTHPEYFALRKDGTRCYTYTGSRSSRNGYLCFSSGVRDAIYEECVRRFKDGKKYVDIMPNDSLPRCLCEKCEAAYSKTDPKCYATELIWDYTRYVANKLIENGIPGIVTQMAYAQYRRIPDFDIPTNVYVMVAESGPWSLANPKELNRQYEEIRAWNRKIGHPVWIWTYPHKYGALNIPGIPDVAPRAWGEYFKGLDGDIIGTFAESETDQWIYHYLNYYVFSRVMWDAKTDVDAVIEEHHRLMFGAGAEPMKRFYETLERKWAREIVGNVKETPMGPVFAPPTEGEIWSKVYGPDTIANLDSLLRDAAAAVAPGSLEARRIAFFRKEYYDRLVAGAKADADKRQAILNLKWKAGSPEPIMLRPFKVRKGREPEEYVKTAVTVERDGDEIVVRYDCEDNRMDDLAFADRVHDDFGIWQDSGIEIFLNPSADRKTFYQIIVNLAGVVSDQRGVRHGMKNSTVDKSWESGAKAQIEKRADGWKATVRIPVASFEDGVKDTFPAEFVRNRVTRSGKGHCLYNWSPFVFGFNSVTEYGTITLR